MVVLAAPASPGGSTRKLPDMPRCRIRCPSPQSTSRYLPRRWIVFTVRPASASTSRGTGQRSRGSRTATPEITRPVSCGARPRRVTSTSGSSGMEEKCACAGHQIYLRWVESSMAKSQLHCRGGACARVACSRLRRSRGHQQRRRDLSEPTLYRFLLGEIAAAARRPRARGARPISISPGARAIRASRAARSRSRTRRACPSSRSRRRASGTTSSPPRRTRCRSSPRCSSPRSASTKPGRCLEKLFSAEGVSRENGVHAGQPPARRQPGQGGEPARDPHARGELPAARRRRISRSRRPRPRRATTPRRSPRRAAAQKLRPDGSSRRCSKRRCCSKRSHAEAAKRLGEFVEKYPQRARSAPQLRARAGAGQALSRGAQAVRGGGSAPTRATRK